MASITQRKTADGRTRFLVQVRLRGHPPQTATFDRKTDAKRWAQKTEVAIREGRHFPASQARKRTLSEVIDQYSEEALPGLADTDRRNRVRQLAWWRQQLGAYVLADVTPQRIAECLALLRKGEGPSGEIVGPATRNRYQAALSAALKWAMQPERSWIESNPARRIPKQTEPAGVIRFLSVEEQDHLLAAAKENPDERMYPLVILALATGARQSELMRLKWSDLDLEQGQVHFQVTKNGSPRRLPIPKQALVPLREWSQSWAPTIGGDHVFGLPGEVYGPACPWFPRKRWEQVREAAGLVDFRFHDLRHTTGSYLAMSGASERENMEYLGHRTSAMARRYSHLATEHMASVAQRMADRFLCRQ